ncbi:Alpha/Beta hydrolase protein [Phyllosticta citribraziliensis]|uniref:Alpha/Beta hydrolase protein n=1 Tax=Phyllosticta citribraziliensis TaxID=989973 RepID=A0ABR1LDU1_9PEZI
MSLLANNTPEAEHFADFHVHHVAYKTVDGQPIETSILVPRDAAPGPRPTIVRWHGGGLVTGARLYTPWFAPWVLAYAKQHSAIIIAPDYRLMPESSGAAVLADVRDFWFWFHTTLGAWLSPRAAVEIDLTRVLLMGESAGAWHVMYSLTRSIAPEALRAAVLTFPMLDLKDAHFSQKARPEDAAMLGVPFLGEDLVDEFEAAAKSDPLRVVTNVAPPERLDLMIAVFQNGRFAEWLERGEDWSPEAKLQGSEARQLYPFELLEDASNAGAQLPPVLIAHGEQDSIVPAAGSRKFVEAWRRLQGAKCELVLQPGEHGFDGQVDYEEEWLQTELKWITEAWLS